MENVTSEATVSQSPKWFWIANIVALLWNLMGLAAFAATIAMMNNEAVLAELPAEQQELYRTTPVWSTAAFAAAVIFGTLGSIGLVLRKKWALPILLLSLLGVLIQDIHMFFLSDAIKVMGGAAAMIMPLIVLTVAIALIPWSRMGITRGWLR